VSQHEPYELLDLTLPRGRIDRECDHSAKRYRKLRIISTNRVPHVLQLLEHTEQLGGICDSGHVAVQRHQQAATCEPDLVIPETVRVPLDRIAACSNRDLQRLLLVAGTAAGAASRAASTATGATRSATGTTTGPSATPAAAAPATATTAAAALSAT
jgi:hypothetical protein